MGLSYTKEARTNWAQQTWVNLIGFQLIWWMCVLLGNSAYLAVIILLYLHVRLHSQPVSEMRVIGVTALLGYSVDSCMTLLGVFQFEGSGLLPPLWLALLWLGFCSTLRQGLHYFRGRYPLAAAAGALGGSSSYIAASKLGAAELGMAVFPTFLLLALVWAALFPCLMYLSKVLGESHVSQTA